MPIVNLKDVEDMKDLTPLPTGEYRCCILSVEETKTNSGSDWWKVKFGVIEGEYERRHLRDDWFFTEKAMPRIKIITSRLGFDTTKSFNLTPDSVIGKEVYLSVVETDYTNDNGDKVLTNKVTFGGYREVTDSSKPKMKDSGEDLPF